MAWQFSIYQLPPFVAALISVALITLVWDRRDNTLGTTFIVFAAGLFAWSLCYTIQLGLTTLDTKLIVYKLNYIGATIVPTTWLVLTARYAGRDDWMTRRTLPLLAIEPLIVLALVATNHTHGLILETATLTTDPIPLASFEFGVAYWINLAYSYLLVIYGIVLLLDLAIRGLQLYRRQATLLIAGAGIPLIANLLFATGLSPIPDIDLTTFSFSITGGVFAVSLYKLDLLSRTPIARRRMTDALGDGFIVVDDTNHVVNYNQTAADIIDDIHIDSPLDTHFDTTELDTLDGTELTITTDHPHHYEIRCLTLDGRRDETVGHLIALREITDRKRYEQRLEVANRLLRHNLRTDTNIILGHADNLRDRVDDTGQTDLDQIQASANRLADLSHKANQLETTLHHGDDRTPVDAVPVTARIIDQYRDTHPDIPIHFDAPDRAVVTTIAGELLEVAIENLIENAIEHTNTAPEITVTITAGDTVDIRVADNGPGIPDIEYDVLDKGYETKLEHGSGIGLWLVHWITTASGGSISVTTDDGTIVTITLPGPE